MNIRRKETQSMSKHWIKPWRHVLRRSRNYRPGDETGFSLLEVLLVMGLVGLMGIVVPSSLSTANKLTFKSNERTIAENLARSQMDYVQAQSYDSINNPPAYNILSNIPATYSIAQTTARLDPKEDGTDLDDGLQRITVTVQHGTNISYTLVDFKINYNP
jgi:type II secretory pathway pseudopilin PulG